MAEQSGKVGAVFATTGSAITETLSPIGTGDGSTTVFYLQETVIDCEAVAPTASGSILAGDWTETGGTGAVTADVDEKEGTYCIKNTVSAVTTEDVCRLIFTPDDNQDWHDRARLLFWMKCDRAQDAFTSARLEIQDGDGNYSYWNLTFAAATYTRQTLLLSTPDGNGGTAADLTNIDLIRLSFVAADGTTFYQQIDFIGLTPKATSQSITLKVGATEQSQDAYIHTVSGKVTFGTAPASGAITATWSNYDIEQIAGFFSWGIDKAANPLEATDFSDGGHKTFIIGLDEWSASAERHWHTDTDMHAWVGTIKIIIFFSDTSSDPRLRWEGWAVVTGLHPGVAVDTIINESLDFQGTGILSYEST
jgi:hypothetical protein